MRKVSPYSLANARKWSGFLFLERFEGIPGEASDFSFIRIRNNAPVKDFFNS